MDTCIFCKIVRKEIEHNLIWENDSYLAFLDRNPVKPGHTLVIPKKHTDYIFDLGDEEYEELFLNAKELSNKLKKALNPKRVGIVVEGFGVPHTHVHLIPINNIGELTPVERVAPSKDELKMIEDIIKNNDNR